MGTKRVRQEVDFDPHPPRSRQGDEPLPGAFPIPRSRAAVRARYGRDVRPRRRRPARARRGPRRDCGRGRPGRECRAKSRPCRGRSGARGRRRRRRRSRAPERVQVTASGGLSSLDRRTIRPTVGCQIRTVRSAPIETTIGGPPSGRDGRRARPRTGPVWFSSGARDARTPRPRPGGSGRCPGADEGTAVGEVAEADHALRVPFQGPDGFSAGGVHLDGPVATRRRPGTAVVLPGECIDEVVVRLVVVEPGSLRPAEELDRTRLGRRPAPRGEDVATRREREVVDVRERRRQLPDRFEVRPGPDDEPGLRPARTDRPSVRRRGP